MNDNYRSHSLSILALLIFSFCNAQQPATNLPNPTVNPDRCGYTRSVRVCDVDAQLTQSEREDVQKAFEKLMRQTTFSKGDFCRKSSLKPFVFLVKKIPSSSAKANNVELKNYAQTLMGQLNGDPQCQRDFVLLLSTQDTATFIEPNSEVRISKSILSDIGQNRALNQLRTGNYAQALIVIADELTREYQKTYENNAPSNVQPNSFSNSGTNQNVNYVNKGPNVPGWVWALIAVVVVLLCCCCCCSMFCKGLRDCFCPCCKNAPTAGNHDFTPGFVSNAAGHMPWYPSGGSHMTNNYFGGDFDGGRNGQQPPSYNMTNSGHWGNDNPTGEGGGGQWGGGDTEPTSKSADGQWGNDNPTGDGGGGQWGGASETPAPEPTAPSAPAESTTSSAPAADSGGGGGQWGSTE